jgi:hypothetical protein
MNLESVRVALWDVRAQWESGVRRLITTQSTLEQWRADQLPFPETPEPAASLRHDVAALREIDVTARALLEEVERALSPNSKTAHQDPTRRL